MGGDRGQAVQVGAVLLFAVLIIGLTIYQAAVVPQQNKEIEFNHYQEARSDMVGVRNAVLTSYVSGDSTFASVDLGTTYPPRIFAVNPGSPSGSLRTGDAVNLTVENTSNVDVTGDVCPGDAATRNLTYSPNYNAFSSAPDVVYENTVAYADYSGGAVTLTDQRLVSGDTITLAPLTRNYSRSGVGRATVESVPGFVIASTVEDPTVTVPTGLSNDTWVDLLQGEVDPPNVSVSGGNLTLDLGGNYTVECSPVGAGGAPDSGARNGGALSGGGGGGGDDGTVNPAGVGAVLLKDATLVNNQEVDLSFKNNGETNRTMFRARLAFLFNSQSSEPTQATVQRGGTVLDVGGDFKTLNGGDGIQVNSSSTETVTLTFDANVKNDLFILSIRFENGDNSRYFVQPE